MFNDREKPQYYAERIFSMVSLIKKYCIDYDDIYEITAINPAIEYLFNLSDKLYCYYLNTED